MKQRVEWIDIAKFIGICCIYLGHFCDAAGLAYHFVFAFHVQLFFFISGCMSTYDQEENILRFIWKKFKRIMIPFYCFAILSIIINAIICNLDMSSITGLLIQVAEGCIRNAFFAGSLWFLSCLFVMEIIFKVLKLLKSEILILISSIVIFGITELLLISNIIDIPSCPYNVDTAFHYLIFYSLGYFLYPYISEFFKVDTTRKKIAFAVLLVLTAVYMFILFEGTSLLSRLSFNQFTNILVQVIQPAIGILFVFLISRMLKGIKLFSKIGQETLYLCGNEYVIKTLFPMFISLFGVSISLSRALKTYIYTLILILVNFFIIIPIEKRVIMFIKKQLARFLKYYQYTKK